MTKIVIYGKANCAFCKKAKLLLNDILDEVWRYEEPAEQFVKELKERTNQYTFPYIYFGDTFIGGFFELEYKYQRGLLYEIATKERIKIKTETI